MPLQYSGLSPILVSTPLRQTWGDRTLSTFPPGVGCYSSDSFARGGEMVNSVPTQVEERSFASVGNHCILELYDCPRELLNDALLIQKVLQEAAKTAQATLLHLTLHQFHPQGITALALLAESHISIHTWPEIGYAAIDVFTCGQRTKPEKACQYLVKIFRPRQHLLLKLPRRMVL